MTPTQRPPDNAPFSPTERVEIVHKGGRRLVIGLLLLSVTLVSAGIGFMVSGGQLPTSGAGATPAATPVAQTAPQPTAQPTPQPTQLPTQQPTQPPATPTTAAVKPTAAPPTSAPTAPAPKPTAAPAKPGQDPRLAQVEGRIREYFSALNAEDYARAHQVCCTEAWRSRYPLDRWERNFDGVTDLRLVGEPRYRRVEPDLIEVDTDYDFVSGGRERAFTLRWTFQPVGGEWQAELAEAFAR